MTGTEQTQVILVVEDESIIGLEIQARLRDLGYQVPPVVRTGEEALNKTAEIMPDLVLMDISLKGNMDGVEAAEEIRQKFDIPIVYLTANTDEQTFQRAKLSGPHGYLLKPFEEKELRTTIEIILYKAETEKKLRDYRKRLEQALGERDNLIEQLQKSLENIKTLKGLLPICASCKKIRDDKGYWNRIESYIKKHSEAEFSHSICPDCTKKLYPDLDLEDE